MTIFKPTCLIMACLAVAACGGGGTSTGGGVASLSDELDALRAIENIAVPTDPGNLPTGSATYTGVANFNTTDLDSIDPSADLADQLEGYNGALSMSVDFVADTISGSVTDFQDLDGNSAPGSVTIANGIVTQPGNSFANDGFATTASGTIDGDAYTWSVDGNFTGDNGDGLLVNFTGRDGTTAPGVGLAAR